MAVRPAEMALPGHPVIPGGRESPATEDLVAASGPTSGTACRPDGDKLVGEAAVGSGQDKSVLSRAAAILDAFKVDPPVVSLSELSSRSGLPKSTVHRLAEQLLALGWLERVTGGYRVGMRLFEVGELAGQCNRMRDSALPHLRKLATTTLWAIHLAVLDRNEVVYLDKIPANKEVDIPSRTGGRMPAYCTGLGKAMLAYEGDEGIERAIAAGLDRRTSNTLTSPDEFRQDLALIRGTGVAYDYEESCPGIACVAAPIRGSGRAIGAVSVTGFSREFRFREMEVAVRQTAVNIWRDLFGSGPRTN
jgi:DNA-binding IclR family transcriptional regulator